jgi:TRAP-type C4-dicarboxylate transport system permease small subunit
MIGAVAEVATRAVKAILGAIMATIVLITVAAVWWRYVLNAPVAWTEQVSNMLFVWTVFLGAAVLYREKLHLGVDMFLEMLPARFKEIAFWTIEIGNLVFIVVLFVYGLKLSLDVIPQQMGALDITPAFYYFAAPVSCALMILYFLEKIVDPTKRVRTGHAGESEF